MNGGSRIVAIGAGAEEAALSAREIEAGHDLPTDAQPQAEEAAEWDEDPAPQPRRRGWLAPAFALLLTAGWTGFFLWANQWALAGVTPQQATALLSTWSVPVLLLAVAWLIAMRTSTRETARFGDAARLLSAESSQLEQRLTVVNRELSLAREFLAAQSRDLDSLGRSATEKLSTHADRLAALVQDNGERVDAIASVSTTALGNMEKLRDQLPVVANSARDVANNIGSAGRTAHAQLKEMVEGFNRLNEFGKASETHVDSLRARIGDTVDHFDERLNDIALNASTRMAELQGHQTSLREQIDANEAEALAAMRKRVGALSEELGTTRSLLDSHEQESLTSLRGRLGALRDESAALARTLRDGEASAADALSRSLERMESATREALERLDQLDQQAMDTARNRVVALGEEATAFDERIAERNRLFAEEHAARTREAHDLHRVEVDKINGLLASLDAAIQERAWAQEARTKELEQHGDAMLARIEAAGTRIADLAGEAGIAEAALGTSLSRLTDSLANSREALANTGKAVSGLTEDSIRLLDLLQASAKQSREQLPEAMALGEAKLEEFERRLAEVTGSLGEAAQRSEMLASNLAGSRSAIGQSLGEIGALQSGLENGTTRHAAMLGDLRTTLEGLDGDTRQLAEYARDEMAGALESLGTAAKNAVVTLEESGGKAVAAIAAKLGDESGTAVERVLRVRMAEAVGSLEEAAGHAAGVSRESAVQLRDQLAKLSELTDNLERRIAQARERAEERVDSDFSRRVALITESLNSNAIDIAKALSSEVTDTAWAAYLRGDRGVFTRRAVRLLETQEARSITAIYGEDNEFREHVSRYIHDFEAMLRQLLATRDGHALSVTLLSSDMGKLYVALAQAIERLRD